MGKRIRKRKCRSCGDYFPPDHRNRQRQKYCSKPECRKASKTASQKRWLGKPSNRSYFRGPENVIRAQQWRKDHPRHCGKKKEALQDDLSVKTLETPLVGPSFVEVGPRFASALQDFFTSQPAVLIGLISHLTDSPLQDDIAKTIRRLQRLGNDILNGPTQNTGGVNDQKAPHLPPAPAPHTQSVQLGGPPSGS
jgi:hypothetical protein